MYPRNKAKLQIFFVNRVQNLQKEQFGDTTNFHKTLNLFDTSLNKFAI